MEASSHTLIRMPSWRGWLGVKHNSASMIAWLWIPANGLQYGTSAYSGQPQEAMRNHWVMHIAEQDCFKLIH